MQKVRIVLRAHRGFDRCVRAPGFVLLEGVLGDHCTAEKVQRAIEQGDAVLEPCPDPVQTKRAKKRAHRSRS